MWRTPLLHLMVRYVLIVTIPQMQWKLTRCMLSAPSDERPRFHASSHLCLQGANKPLPMLLFSARDNSDMFFRPQLSTVHSCREGGTVGGVRCVSCLGRRDMCKNYLHGRRRSQAVSTPTV